MSIAHNGVLFLDEVTEFRRDVLEGLRVPLEDGRVVITRASGAVEFPARFTLVAASNPCPCGFEGDPRRACRCLPARGEAYRQKLSGPLLDRVDIRLTVPRLTRAELLGSELGERSDVIRARVEGARERQRRRLAGTYWTCNAQMPGGLARKEGWLSTEAESFLSAAVESLSLSGRGFDRAVKVARTIADLEGYDGVEGSHMAEALGLRAPPVPGEVVAVG